MATEKQATDVLVENHGTIFMFRPQTEAAKAWVKENVQAEQWLGNGFAVEPRYARDLAAGMLSAGLVVK